MPYVCRLADCNQRQAEIETFRPFDAHTLAQLRAYYRVGLTYTSNALEGSTLTETETKVVLEDGITIGGKPLSDHLAALGHANAYDHLYTLLDAPSITEAHLLRLHQLVTEGVPEAEPGQYRSKPVIITGSTYLPPPPAELPAKMAALVAEQLPHWLSNEHPIHAAAMAHWALVNIHPFCDGNGRTARLLMNLLLMRAGYGITLIAPILRQDYIACLDTAHTQGDRVPFLNLVSNVVYESATDLLRLLRHLRSA